MSANGEDIVTILPAHVPINADGVPVLCSNRDGRRMRYTVAPIAPTSWPAHDRPSSISAMPNPAPRAVPRHARCVVCSLGMQQPMSTPCGHAMCAGCQPAPGDGDKIRCPKCDMTCLASSVKPSPMLSWLLGGVRVKCVPAPAIQARHSTAAPRLVRHLLSGPRASPLSVLALRLYCTQGS
jgi:hypothetical protein